MPNRRLRARCKISHEKAVLRSSKALKGKKLTHESGIPRRISLGPCTSPSAERKASQPAAMAALPWRSGRSSPVFDVPYDMLDDGQTWFYDRRRNASLDRCQVRRQPRDDVVFSATRLMRCSCWRFTARRQDHLVHKRASRIARPGSPSDTLHTAHAETLTSGTDADHPNKQAILAETHGRASQRRECTVASGIARIEARAHLRSWVA